VISAAAPVSSLARDPGNPAAVESDVVDLAVTAAIGQVMAQPIADWGIFTTLGPIAVSAKKPDGTYRTVPLAGTEEFTFSGMYVGKRGGMIFTFTPIDPTYTAFEFPADKVFTSVPALEHMVIKALGGNVDAVFDRPGEGYAAALSQFRAKHRKVVVAEKKAEQVAKIEENVERQKANPLWGMF
jgi:hypothetical protein